MLKDIKLGFKLLRYGYKLKLNVIMFVFFAVIGIASDIMSKGTSIIGGDILYDVRDVYISAHHVDGCVRAYPVHITEKEAADIHSGDVKHGNQSCCFHISGGRKSHSDTEWSGR